jgi:pantetheine-phosphate adenylyltransferase
MKPARTRALYAGSFDPITRGHMDIVRKALKTFDVVHLAVGVNPRKQGLFDVAERVDLIRASILDADVGGAGGDALPAQVEIGSFAGESVIKYAHRIGATHVVRGLRQFSDFDDEFRYHGMFGRLEPHIPLVHFICHESVLHVSSSTARELAALDEDIAWLVTPSVEAALKKKFAV